ncbi:transcription factor Pcc1 [Fusarium beomiforme]|uniref:Transcription factor Pcc1 n=1 Tax=Fusarium beomiforme TaxID=44412 RepID=A0A9P5DTP0_9HYPO|nr:transcription factor Pcc1 [Fusarium beomiforme]
MTTPSLRLSLRLSSRLAVVVIVILVLLLTLTLVHSVLNVPFPTARLATTALKAIQVDPELSPLVRRQLTVVPAPASTQGSPSGDDANARLLEVQYKATTNRMLRVAVNGFMESLKLVVEVMEQLDTDVLDQQ